MKNEPIAVVFDGFALHLIRAGTHVMQVDPNDAILDVYLGDEEGTIAFAPGSSPSHETPAMSFSFFPPAFLQTVKIVRPGPTVLLAFQPGKLRIPPIRDTIAKAADPLLNWDDTGMIGAGIVTRDYLETPNHTVRRAEVVFLRDLLSIRLTQVLRL